MADLRYDSEPPADLIANAVSLVWLGERLAVMGWDGGEALPGLSDPEHRTAVLDELERQGVGQVVLSRLRRTDDPAVWADGLAQLHELVEDSPAPLGEWRTMTGRLGTDLLTELVGVSKVSLARYRSGERSTPDAVAARLHHVALVVADLAGSYNDFGIRRWFARPRQALGGAAPSQLLRGQWSPEDNGPTTVSDLARSLLAAGAT